ncbi:MAG: branched-chain amino acid aminotransferase [Nitrospira sp.]|nr:branched-chain amino acid aminotransferase [Nitrospira sp.]
MWIFLNDRFVDQKEAVVSVFDHGFLYGDGVYETLRSYGGRFFMLQPHLARLQRSARLIGLELPIPLDEWPPLLHEALDRNELQDAHLRITISRGEGELGLDPALCRRPTLVIMARPLARYPDRLFEEGVSLAIVAVRRNPVSALSPRIKSLNFLNNILAKQEAARAGAFDALMLNAEGLLTESTTSNLFFAREGRLYTPSIDCGILDGITREVVLTLAREAGIQTEEGRYSIEALARAEEAFLTNTSMEIMPVCSIDRQPVGSGRPGPLTRQLRDLFKANFARFLSPSRS